MKTKTLIFLLAIILITTTCYSEGRRSILTRVVEAVEAGGVIGECTEDSPVLNQIICKQVRRELETYSFELDGFTITLTSSIMEGCRVSCGMIECN